MSNRATTKDEPWKLASNLMWVEYSGLFCAGGPGSGQGFVDQDGGWFLPARGRRDIKPIPLGNPNGSAGAGSRWDLLNEFEGVHARALMHIHIADVLIAAAGN